ncbi:nucleotide sugar dehydrogenase [Corynebacterium minutissimum]|uniref:nucleotide sugar dehydrogenase n=1 Tax=Corynebacterium minutissimum TaxID=38301 RepID=UPI001EF2E463|nr:nucleotide sugar dehydrogenase [Corynebacterium minutissimum]MCG7228937.1 nucleotide sugar dehydrogenase [Corynebacterium minutissimum]MCG7238054.1 nucleotide sugar dehydrogenase [Corynebacterium minutissimum]
MNIAVVALGKIGLPLAVQFAKSGHTVVGVDINKELVDTINQAREPFPGEKHLDEYLKQLVPAGKLRATTEYSEAIPQADAIVLVVPLFVNDETWEPDFNWMDQATKSLAEHLTPSTLISYETTLPVGTTRNRWKPMIEEISGLEEGKDFDLVFSPERVLTGRVFEDLRRYPKLVGGLSDEGTLKGMKFYEEVLQFEERPDLPRENGVWDMGTAEAAEMAKLAETTYRDVNIGLANQFAVYADAAGIDVYKVIDACNSQPFSHIHRPGIAVGGHCIPVYPRLYLSTDKDATVVREARKFNATMPEYCVKQLANLLGDLSGLKVAVLGASYRGGVKETAFSGVFATVDALRERNAAVVVHDPMYTASEISDFGWDSYQLGEPVDAVIVQADHEEYKSISAEDFPGIKAIFDGRRITDADKWNGTPRLTIG